MRKKNIRSASGNTGGTTGRLINTNFKRQMRIYDTLPVVVREALQHAAMDTAVNGLSGACRRYAHSDVAKHISDRASDQWRRDFTFEFGVAYSDVLEVNT